MNFNDTMASVELVLSTKEVPLIVGTSGIGKTALAQALAKKNKWNLVVIDGNLLKEGEIGGLPTIETYELTDQNGTTTSYKTTVYAIHNKLREIDKLIQTKQNVLLFIDEINRCEHTVQQELMNLILNREINGYQLSSKVNILAAMNPSTKYGSDFDYQVVDMDAAQENRFVWLFMESDHLQWLNWAISTQLDSKIIDFISTFPDYLNRANEDTIRATPRSYERISKLYVEYKKSTQIPRSVFVNVVKGNIGEFLAEEFIHFIESEQEPLIGFEDVFSGNALSPLLSERIQKQSHTRLYLSAKNLLNTLEQKLQQDSSEEPIDLLRLPEFLTLYPVDLRVGIMKEIKQNYDHVYKQAIELPSFVDLYFESYAFIKN